MEVDRKLMDYLARRPHSEKELREKLLKKFEIRDVDRAVAHAKEMGWIEAPHKLSARVAEELARKGKGHRYIQGYLGKKGLPSLARNREGERKNATALVAKHLKLHPPYSHNDKAHIFRLLKNRGYDYDTIQSLFHDSL